MARLTSFAILFLTLVILLLAIAGPHGLIHLLDERREIRALEAKNREIETEILATKSEIFSLQMSDDALEEAAREQAGLSKPGEIVYILPSAETGLRTADEGPASERAVRAGRAAR